MPEEEQRRSPPAWWLSVWQRRWWIALATLFILVWWLVPPLLYRHTGTAKDAKLKAITDTRTALLAGLIGVGALLTSWLNSRVYRITAQTAQITAQTFDLARQGQITERYTKAIEQLGSDKLDVRLGGIYALERIAKDSPRDQPTVVEVMSAFVRKHSRGNGTDTSWSATDVQATLSVLGRLPQQANVPRGDLAGVQAAFANLAGADLAGAKLVVANLTGAELIRANLSGAQLGGADLTGAKLWGANLSGAQLNMAELFGAELYGAVGLTQEQLDTALGQYAD